MVRTEFEGLENRIETTPEPRERLRQEVEAIIQRAEAVIAMADLALRSGGSLIMGKQGRRLRKGGASQS